MFFRVVNDLARGVTQKGIPDIAVCFNASLGQHLDSGRNRGISVIGGLVDNEDARLESYLAFPQMQNPYFAVG
jgi:hypothetical protein